MGHPVHSGSYSTWEPVDIKDKFYCPKKAFWFSAKSLFPLVVILVVHPILYFTFYIATACSQGKEQQEEDPEKETVPEK